MSGALLPTSPSRRPGAFQAPRKSRAHAEQDFHKQVAGFLSVALAGNVFFTTIPLGGGGRLRGAILQSMGVKPGLPDIMLIDSRRAMFLELKAQGGRLSLNQVVCHKRLSRAGCPVAVVRNLNEVIDALRDWGVPTRVSP